MLGEFRRDAEFVLYAVKEKARPASRKFLPGVFKHAVNPARKMHLTSNPLKLLKDLLSILPEGVTVLDPFLGGGTTALACLETKRRFIGVELSEEYMALACEQIRAAEAGEK